jgi:hypothetical protein
MKSLLRALRRIHTEEDGHAVPGFMSLVAAVGAVVLAIGAASDSDVVTIIGGVALGIGILAGGVLNHMVIDYDIYARLETIEKK